MTVAEVRNISSAAKFRAALAAFIGTAVANDKEDTLNEYLAANPDTLKRFGASINRKAEAYFIDVVGANKFVHFGTLKAGINPPANTTPVTFNYAEWHAVAIQGAATGNSVEFISKNRRGEDVIRLAVPFTVVGNDSSKLTLAKETNLPVHVVGLRKVLKNDGSHSHFLVQGTGKKSFWYEVLGLTVEGLTTDQLETGSDSGMLIHTAMLKQAIAYMGISAKAFQDFEDGTDTMFTIDTYVAATFAKATEKETMYLDRSTAAVAFALANNTSLVENGKAAVFYNGTSTTVFSEISNVADKAMFEAKAKAHRLAAERDILRDSNSAAGGDLMKQAREVAAQDGLSLLDAMQVVKAMREALAIA